MTINSIKKLFSAAALAVIFSFLALGLVPLAAFAQAANPPPSTAAPQTTQARCAAFKSQFTLSSGVSVIGGPVYCSASKLLADEITYIIDFAGIICILFLIIGGFFYMTSAGNEEQSEKGKKILVNAIIGLVIIMMSYAIVRIVATTLALK